MPQRITNHEAILMYLEERGSMTTYEGVTELGIVDVRKRISELRKLGHNIVSEPRTGVNRYGMATHYNIYRLEG